MRVEMKSRRLKLPMISPAVGTLARCQMHKGAEGIATVTRFRFI